MIAEGTKVKINSKYGGGTGVVESNMGSFYVVKMPNGSTRSFHESNLTPVGGAAKRKGSTNVDLTFQGRGFALYMNQPLKEYYILGGVKDLAHAWNAASFVSHRTGWNEGMFSTDVRVRFFQDSKPSPPPGYYGPRLEPQTHQGGISTSAP